MSDRLIGTINPISTNIQGILSTTSSLVGGLNIYTMETGDGRELELCVIDGAIRWRRVGDTAWILLVSLENIKGDKPIKGTDYFTSEDIALLIEEINTDIGENIPLSSIAGLNEILEENAQSITSLTTTMSHMIQDKYYLHRQSIASDHWSIAHNLDKMPAVVAKDSAGNTVIGEIEYIDSNNLNLIFSGSFSGVAYLN